MTTKRSSSREQRVSKMFDSTTCAGLLKEIEAESWRACQQYGPYDSLHEGVSVIREEFEELWEEVKKRPSDRQPGSMRKEAVQVAATALTLALQLTVEDLRWDSR